VGGTVGLTTEMLKNVKSEREKKKGKRCQLIAFGDR
jgi:hypothetical protein